jgi:hypothetical protein
MSQKEQLKVAFQTFSQLEKVLKYNLGRVDVYIHSKCKSKCAKKFVLLNLDKVITGLSAAYYITLRKST